MTRGRAAFTVLAAAVTFAGAGSAQGNRWVRQVRGELARAHESLVRSGFERVRPDRTGLLNTGEAELLSLTLAGAAQYAVIAVCDGDCDALSLVVYNASDYEVASDRGRGEGALVELRPREGGPFRIKVVMAECRLNPCWFGVAVYRRTVDPRPGPEG